MSDQNWILLDAGGVVIGQVITPRAVPTKGDNAGQAFAMAEKVSRQGDLRTEIPDRAGGWVEDPSKVEAILIAELKTEAERRKMLNATPGGYKMTEYSEKAQEVAAYDNSGSTVTAIVTAIGLIPAEQKAVRFKWALASQAAFGESTITPAIERFRGGVSRAAINPRIGAFEEKTTAAIRAAPTAAQKREVVANLTWPS